MELFPKDKRLLIPLDYTKKNNITLFNKKFYHYFDDLRDFALCFMLDLNNDPSVILDTRIKSLINRDFKEKVYNYVKESVEQCPFGSMMVYRLDVSKEYFWKGYFDLFISMNEDKFYNPTVIIPEVPEDQMEFIVQLAKEKLVNIVVFDFISYEITEQKDYDKNNKEIDSYYELNYVNSKDDDKLINFCEIFRKLYNKEEGTFFKNDDQGNNSYFIAKNKKSLSTLLGLIENQPFFECYDSISKVTLNQIEEIKIKHKISDQNNLVLDLVYNKNALTYLEFSKGQKLNQKVDNLSRAISFYKKKDDFKAFQFNKLYYYLNNNIEAISKFIKYTDLDYLYDTDLGFNADNILFEKLDQLLKSDKVLEKFQRSFDLNQYQNVSLSMIMFLFNHGVLSCKDISVDYLLQRSDKEELFSFLNEKGLSESKMKEFLIGALDRNKNLFDLILGKVNKLSLEETKLISSSNYFINEYHSILPLLKEKSGQVYVDSIFWNAFLTNKFKDVLSILKDEKLILSEDLVDLICFRMIKKKEQFKASMPEKHDDIVSILEYCMDNNLLKNKDLEKYLKKIK